MCQEMPDRDRFPRVRRAVEKLADVVIETELSVLDQEHDAGRDELLAYGTDFINRLRSGRNVQLDIREAVTLHLDDLPVLDHDKRKTGKMLALHFGFDVFVDLFVSPNCD